MIMAFVADVISKGLTARQREVIDLYFRQQHTQARTAQKLGITQPTVSQHLNGKMRDGKKVGGAIRRIRKSLGHRTRGGWLAGHDADAMVAVVRLLNGG